jgi:L-threonylcarbamoyladenylate synthase
MSIISNCTESAIKEAAFSLISGNLVAFPTETVYGLGADATNKDAIARIYSVKGRPTGHPLIVHISSLERLDKWAREIPEYAIKLARNFWPGPMTLILPRTDLAKDFITGGQDNVGLRVPSHPVALALLKAFEAQGGVGIAAPSANRFGAVSPTNVDNVKSELSTKLSDKDLILNGGSSFVGIESTIINCTNSVPSVLRPGAITLEIINDLFDNNFKEQPVRSDFNIKVPGLLDSHYRPNAKVFITGTPSIGDGLIALANHPTPNGVVRLASPTNNEEYARTFYHSLYVADSLNLGAVYVIPPIGGGIADAINDRLSRCSFKPVS